MLANIFTKSIHDRWRGTLIAFVSLMLMLLFAMSIYRNFDLNIYQEMPEVLKTIMGIPASADVGALAISVFLSGAGAWVLAGLTIASGSASIASEESNGTIGLLLGNPKGRTRVLVSKAAAMTLLMLVLVAASWGTTYLIALALDVNIGEMKVYALALHLLLIALFHGFLAMAIGAWTGNRGAAAGVTTGVMFVSVFAVGLLPLIEGWENLAKIFPWYYLNGSEPLFNGVDGGHAGILAVCIAGLLILSVIGLNRRDLKSQNVGVTMLDQLRSYPLTQKVISRLAGSTRVSRIWVKTFSEHQTLLTITGYVMFLTAILIGVLYKFMPMDTMTSLIENFPEAEVFLAAFGGGGFDSPEGFFKLEIFSLMAPAVLILVGIVVGTKALSGEESRNTMGLLLANPVRRSRIVLEKTLAMIVCCVVAGIVTFLGTAAGSLLGRLNMDMDNIAAICLLCTLLGMVFGTFSLFLSALTGQGKMASFGSTGIALVAYLTYSFLPLSENLAGYVKWSPWYYFLGNDPLVKGIDWWHAVVLAVTALVLVIFSVYFFQRRDLRYNG